MPLTLSHRIGEGVDAGSVRLTVSEIYHGVTTSQRVARVKVSSGDGDYDVLVGSEQVPIVDKLRIFVCMGQNQGRGQIRMGYDAPREVQIVRFDASESAVRA